MVTWTLFLEKLTCGQRLGRDVGGGDRDVYGNIPGRWGPVSAKAEMWTYLGLPEEPKEASVAGVGRVRPEIEVEV